MSQVFDQPCGCADCEGAVSPAAYLTTLCDYALKHVRRNGVDNIDIPYLSAVFHQPFADLPTDCDASETSVRQVRICIESLRSYLGARPLPAADKESALTKGEADYAFLVYTLLLNRIGTSYDEIRRARADSPGDRAALAERLGISLTVPRPADVPGDDTHNGDELDQFYLTPDPAAVDHRLTARAVERLFGLADTERDPLSDGPVFGDDQSQIRRCNLTGVEWNRNTDTDGWVYATLAANAGGCRIELHRNPERTALVAAGEITATNGIVRLMPENDSKLYGYVTVDMVAPTSHISISAIPAALAWRLRRLQAQWVSQDFPNDPYTDGAAGRLPVVDPDLIGPDDFRVPVAKADAADPDRAFDLWLARRDQVDEAVLAMQATREASGFDEMLKGVLGEPLPDLEQVLADLSAPSTTVAQIAREAVAAMSLSTESFRQLMALRAKDRAARNDVRADPVDDAEWADAYSILSAAMKRAWYPAWCAEESDAAVVLGPIEFWLPAAEPQPGQWPPARNPGQPLLDPALTKRADLPEWRSGQLANTLWANRSDEVAATTANLRQIREANGFDAMLRAALGHPDPGSPLPHDLDDLKTGLASADADVRSSAAANIANDLHLSLDDFTRLMTVQSADSQPDPLRKPADADWVAVYALLTPAAKVKHLYPEWTQQESDAGLTYWQAHKAKLPRWRATGEARQLWVQALIDRSRPPTIDPTVIAAEDLRSVVAGDPAYDLWKARHDKAIGRRAELQAVVDAAAPDQHAALDAVIIETLGITPADLQVIAADRAAGRAVSSRLDQLPLDSGGFAFLMRMIGLADSGQTLAASEWDVVINTLMASETRRHAGLLRAEESGAGIALTPGLFQVATAATGVLAQLSSDAPFWLRVDGPRRDWQDALQSRVDQLAAAQEALRSAVSAVEELALPGLRDALIAASDAPGTDLAERGEWIAARLLLDARSGGCRTTTRVSQAIETFQTLLFGLRSGQFAQFGPDPLMLIDAHFDEEWKWIGSYATFRSASFVFLYPENICQPSLLQEKSPELAALVSRTRGQRLDPAEACASAQTYSDYFSDVCSLTIQATCQASTVVYAGGDCSRRSPVRQSMFYMFAKAKSGKTYWSAYPVDAPAGARHQTFWREIAVLGSIGAGRIVGAMPYRTPAANRGPGIVSLTGSQAKDSFIHVFCCVGDTGKQTLQMVKLNLDDFGVWASGVTPLSAPLPISAALEIVPVQTQNERQRPGLLFHTNRGNEVFYRTLNSAGTDWTPHSADWAGFLSVATFDKYPSDATTIVEIHAAASVEGELWLVVSKAFTRLAGVWTLPGAGKKITHWSAFTLAGVTVTGIVAGPETTFPMPNSTSEIHLFTRDSATGAASYWRFYLRPDGVNVDSGPRFDALDDVSEIVPHSGTGTAAETLAYRKRSGRQAFYAYSFTRTGDRLRGVGTTRMTLRVSAANTVPLTMPAAALQQRRLDIIKAFDENADAPLAILRYLHEAYFHVPMQLALALNAAGYYLAALDCFRTIYDYEAPVGPPNLRNIYYGLELDAKGPEQTQYQHAEDWLLDPLNPHLIASTRRLTYTRFTLITLCRLLLGYADAEFSRETVESLATARILYVTALKVLRLDAINQRLGACDDLIASLKIQPGADVPAEASAAVAAIIADLTSSLSADATFKDTLIKIEAVVAADHSWIVKLAEAREIAQIAIAAKQAPSNVASTLADKKALLEDKSALLISDAALDYAVTQVSKKVAAGIAVAAPKDLAGWVIDLPAFPPPPAVPPPAPPVVAGPALQFCVPPNPVVKQLRTHAELNLYKLRTCRNIAGMKRQLDAYAAPTDSTSGLPVIGAGGQLTLPGATTIRPSLYHERVLRDRAKELVAVAAQMESAMLAALEKGAAERYTVMKARQDLGLAEAGVRLQNLRVNRANHSVRLAELQRQRASTAATAYEEWIAAGLNEYEEAMLAGYDSVANLQKLIAEDEATIQILQAMTTAATASNPGAAAAASAAAAQVAAAAISRTEWSSDLARRQRDIQRDALYASYERRKDEWELQRDLAAIDVTIGDQSIQLANDDVAISEQEKVMAELNATHARDTLEYLSAKFTGPDLYDSMAATLEGVYSFFLRYATAAARMYENQIAFLRQEAPLGVIKDDYWSTPVDDPAARGSADQKGLTGSARLMQDLYQLDQFAFESKKRKLALSKTISLADLLPAEFQRFRETGVLGFTTPMELFDRDFPGHYLRLISRVRTTVIALVPPVDGIHATLSNSGLSKVVVGPEIFQAVPIRKDPESVALTTPVNATGVIEMDTQQADMLSPFEGCGVHTSWEFRMPKAANQIDYRHGIADVLVTYEYTALDSADYRQQVIQSLRPTITAERAFNFHRGPFVDQWYDLNHPDQTAQPMRVTCETLRGDYPINLEALKIAHVMLYFVRAQDSPLEVEVGLHYTPQGQFSAVGGRALTTDGTISTRRGNAGSWAAMIGKSPVGTWELDLPDTEEMRRAVADEEIIDLMLVISYSGRLPAWPDF